MSPSGGAKPLVLYAAVADNGVIGAGGDIPWRIPEDWAHFKRETTGQTLVMGRATYESIGRPLPGRTTVVLTRDPQWSAPGVRTAHDLAGAVELAVGLPGERIVVAGGAAVYAEALPAADAQVLTLVHQAPKGDTYYPDYPKDEWREDRRVEGPGCTWLWLSRR